MLANPHEYGFVSLIGRKKYVRQLCLCYLPAAQTILFVHPWSFRRPFKLDEGATLNRVFSPRSPSASARHLAVVYTTCVRPVAAGGLNERQKGVSNDLRQAEDCRLQSPFVLASQMSVHVSSPVIRCSLSASSFNSLLLYASPVEVGAQKRSGHCTAFFCPLLTSSSLRVCCQACREN